NQRYYTQLQRSGQIPAPRTADLQRKFWEGMKADRMFRLPHSWPTTEVLGGMRAGRMFRPRGRRPRTPARGRCPWTPRYVLHGQRGSPPVTPPTATVPTLNDAGYRWRRTETPHSGHTSGGGPRKTVVPPKNRILANLRS